MKRLKLFVVDSGWDSPSHRILSRSMAAFEKCLSRHEVFVMDRALSADFMADHPYLIGKDPIVAVVDPEALSRGVECGVRLMLGHVNDPVRTYDLLNLLLSLVNDPEKSEDLPEAIRREIHDEGVEEAVDIVLEEAAHVDMRDSATAYEAPPDEDEAMEAQNEA